MNNPLVSISCITYNHAPYIRECLDGFLMQQCDFDFEVLIHDDASTDGTQEIIKEYQEKYPEIIKPIFQTENQYSQGVRGMMARFNFPRAKGKYIALCEGDDYWTDPLKLQKQVDFLEKNSSFAISFHDVQIISEAKIIKPHKIPKKYRRDLTSREICGSITLPTLSLLFRNFKMLTDIPRLKVVNGDKVLLVFLASMGNAHFHSDIIAVYRVHNHGIWSTISEEMKLKSNYKTYSELSKLKIKNRDILKKNAIIYLLKIKDLDKDFYKKEKTKFSNIRIFWVATQVWVLNKVFKLFIVK